MKDSEEIKDRINFINNKISYLQMRLHNASGKSEREYYRSKYHRYNERKNELMWTLDELYDTEFTEDEEELIDKIMEAEPNDQ